MSPYPEIAILALSYEMITYPLLWKVHVQWLVCRAAAHPAHPIGNCTSVVTVVCTRGERPRLTACGCKWLGLVFSMLSSQPGRLLQLQTCIDYSSQRLRLPLRGVGRKVCNVFSSQLHNRFSWYCQPALSVSCIVMCNGVSLTSGAFSDFLCFSILLIGYPSLLSLRPELCLLQPGPCLIKWDSSPVVTVEAAINSISISPFICFLKSSL